MSLPKYCRYKIL